MLNSLAELLTEGIMAVLAFFPDSPFSALDTLAGDETMATVLGYVNWFIPVNTFVGIFEGWLLCVVLYYVWQVILRWVKVIE